MQSVVIDKPYVPVLPHQGRIWPALLSIYLPRLLRKAFGVARVETVHVERLTESLKAGHGILLAPNHCRDEDPLVLGMLARAARTPVFIMASWHIFMQSRLQTFFLTRAGAFSIHREGIDRGAVNTAVGILEEARRPLVIFPEGLISRSNDRFNVLLEGTTLIARSAAKKRAKPSPPGKVVIHPIAIRYRFHGNIESAAATLLDEIEARLTWRPSRELPLLERIYKVGTALLTLKELEYIGQPQSGTISERLQRLIDAILNPLEDQWVESQHDGAVTVRVKRLRTAIVTDIVKSEIDEADRQKRWKDLADVDLAQQLHHYPPDYVSSNTTPERILETIERFEQDLTGNIRLHGPLSATVTVGRAIEVSPTREARGLGDPILQAIEDQWCEMLGPV